MDISVRMLLAWTRTNLLPGEEIGQNMMMYEMTGICGKVEAGVEVQEEVGPGRETGVWKE